MPETSQEISIKNSANLRTVYDLAPVGVCIAAQNDKILYANPALATLTGQTDIIGKKLPDLLPRDEHKKIVQAVHDGTTLARIYACRRKTGRISPFHHWFLTMNRPASSGQRISPP